MKNKSPKAKKIITHPIEISPNAKNVPDCLKKVQLLWKQEADFYGDRGACVLGAGFNFQYEGQQYFMPALSIWQGSLSWEHCRNDIEDHLTILGAEQISYDYGVMD